MTGDGEEREAGRRLLAVCGNYVAAQRQLLTAMGACGFPAKKLAGLRAELDQVEAAVAHAKHDLR